MRVQFWGKCLTVNSSNGTQLQFSCHHAIFSRIALLSMQLPNKLKSKLSMQLPNKLKSKSDPISDIRISKCKA